MKLHFPHENTRPIGGISRVYSLGYSRYITRSFNYQEITGGIVTHDISGIHIILTNAAANLERSGVAVLHFL